MEDWQRAQCEALKPLVDIGSYGWEDCVMILELPSKDYVEARSILLGIPARGDAGQQGPAQAGSAGPTQREERHERRRD